MSEQVPVPLLDTPSQHPVHLVVTDDLRRSRLTVFFRLLLLIPHLVWLVLWGIAVWFAVVAAWFVGIVTGRIPDGLHRFVASYLRYLTHVYAYAVIAADPFPAFSGAVGYPVDVEFAPPAQQRRLTIFFRFFLFIPAYLVLTVLGYVAEIVAVGAWFMGLFMGRIHGGLRDVLAYWLRYNAQALAYVCLLTQRYPSFSDE